MITLADYSSLDATGLAAAIASGEVTPADAVEAALAAIEAVNPRINAVVRRLDEAARLDALTAKRGPFAGVPLAIKELTIAAAGVPHDMGSRLTQGFTPSADSELMARFRRAGFVLVATAQTPEFGYNPTTECVLHGPVRNPYDLGRSAGGSSGGSAAAVAAGCVPVAHANDGGGSIRIPAGNNGLVGLKPSRDRIPTGPNSADPLFGLAIDFAVTRSVRDCARLLDAVAGPDLGAPSMCAPPARPFAAEVGAPVGKLRIAYTTRAASGANAHPDCISAVEKTARLLAELGHEVVADAPQFDWDPFIDTVHVLWCTGTAFAMDRAAAALGRTPSADLVEAVTWACYEDGRRASAADLQAALAQHNRISRAVAPFYAPNGRYDILLTPTIAQPAAPLGQLDQNRVGLAAIDWTRQVFAYCPFTPLFNTTGQPAISLPLHSNAAGLPIGIQLAGRFGDEAGVLRLAAQLEQAQPWHARRPTVHAATAA